jgi:hypothetical protein
MSDRQSERGSGESRCRCGHGQNANTHIFQPPGRAHGRNLGEITTRRRTAAMVRTRTYW